MGLLDNLKNSLSSVKKNIVAPTFVGIKEVLSNIPENIEKAVSSLLSSMERPPEQVKTGADSMKFIIGAGMDETVNVLPGPRISTSEARKAGDKINIVPIGTPVQKTPISQKRITEEKFKQKIFTPQRKYDLFTEKKPVLKFEMSDEAIKKEFAKPYYEEGKKRFAEIEKAKKELPDWYEEPGVFGQFRDSLIEGTYNAIRSIGGAMQAAGAESSGSNIDFSSVISGGKKLEDWAMKKIVSNPELAAPKDAGKWDDPVFYSRMAGSFLPSLVATMGSAAIATAVGGPELGIAVGSVVGGSMAGGDAYLEALDFGASPEQAGNVAKWVGIATGILERSPIGAILERNPAGKQVKKNLVSRMVKGMVAQGWEEGKEEAFQQIATNAVMDEWDKNRELFDGVLESFVGGFLSGAPLGGFGTIYDTVKESSVDDKYKSFPNIADYFQQANIQPAESFREKELADTAKTLRGTKGMTADDIMKTYPNIQLKKDVQAKDVAGNKVTIPEGEKLTPYELKDGKILLQDGETYLVSKNQFQNIKGSTVGGEAKPFAPELDALADPLLKEAKKYKSAEEFVENFGYDFKKNVEKSLVENTDIMSSRHRAHSIDPEDMFYSESSNNGKWEVEIEHIADEIENINITGKEKQISKELRKKADYIRENGPLDITYDESSGISFEDALDNAYDFYSKEKENANNIIEEYLTEVEEMVKEYGEEISLVPSGFKRGLRYGLGEDFASNTTRNYGKIEAITDYQLTDIWNKARGKVDPLIQEAKKYKSAEEFVKTNFKPNPEISKGADYSANISLKLDNPKIVLGNNVITKNNPVYESTKQAISDGTKIPPIRISIDPQGNIIVKDGNHRLLASRELGKTEIPAVFDRGTLEKIYIDIQTGKKSQLTDIWNKARGKVDPLIQTSGKMYEAFRKKEREANAEKANQFMSNDEAAKASRDFRFIRELNVPTHFKEAILTPQGKEAWGRYSQGMIEYVNNPEAGTIPHEAVHAFMDLMMTPAQKEAVYNEYRAKTNNYSSSNQQIEEMLAEDFIQYYNNKKSKTGAEKSFSMKNFFERFLDFIKKVLGLSDKINAFYDDVIYKAPNNEQLKKINGIMAQNMPFISQNADVQMQYYRNPKELTIKFLSSPLLDGRTSFNIQYLKDSVKSGKMPVGKKEVDFVTDILNNEFYGRDKITRAEFEDAIERNLLPISVVESDRYATYGLGADGLGIENDISEAKTFLINSGYHIGDDLVGSGSSHGFLDEASGLLSHVRMAFDDKGRAMVTEIQSDPFQKDLVADFDVRPIIEQKKEKIETNKRAIERYKKSQEERQGGNYVGMFDKTYYPGLIAANESDIKKLEKEIEALSSGDYGYFVNEVQKALELYPEGVTLPDGTPNKRTIEKRKSLQEDLRMLKNNELPERFKKRYELNKKYHQYRNTWPELSIRQAIKIAADRGASYLDFPTAFTATRVENWDGQSLGDASTQYTADDVYFGNEIEIYGEPYIIVKVYEDGGFSAVSSKASWRTDISDVENDYREQLIENASDSGLHEEVLDQIKLDPIKWKNELRADKERELENTKKWEFEDTKAQRIKKIEEDLKAIESLDINDFEKDDIGYNDWRFSSVFDDLIENKIYNELDPLDWLQGIYGIDNVFVSDDGKEFLTFENAEISQFDPPSEGKDPQKVSDSRSEFIKGTDLNTQEEAEYSRNGKQIKRTKMWFNTLDPEYQGAAYRYEVKNREYLNKIRGKQNVQDYLDDNGYTWHRIEIKDSDRLPVQAFREKKQSFLPTTQLKNDFEAMGPGHKKMSGQLHKLVIDGTMLPEHRNVILEALKTTNDQWLDKIDTMSSAQLRRAGNSLYKNLTGEGRIKIKRGQASDTTKPYGDPAKVFLHEYGHLAYYGILSTEEKADVKRAYDRIGKRGIKKHFSNVYGVPESDIAYYAKNEQEFFVDSFAQYVLANKVPDSTLKKLFDKIITTLKAAIERLRGIEKPVALKNIENLFEKMLKTDPKLVEKAKKLENLRAMVAGQVSEPKDIDNKKVVELPNGAKIDVETMANTIKDVKDKGMQAVEAQVIADEAELTKNPTQENFEKFKSSAAKFFNRFREVIEDDWIRVLNIIRDAEKKTGKKVEDVDNMYERRKLSFGKAQTLKEEGQEAVKKLYGDIVKTADNLKVDRETMYDNVMKFLIARHAPERNEKIGEGAAGITTEDADAEMERLKSLPEFNEIERLGDEILAFNKQVTKTLYNEGVDNVISKDLYDLLADRYKYHVPLNRIKETDEDVSTGLQSTGKGLDVKSTGIRSAKGSDKEVNDILENILMNYEQAIERSQKNIIDNATLRFARKNNEIFPGLFEEIKPKIIGVKSQKDPTPVFEKITDPLVLTLRENGKPVYLKINDKRLALALRGVNRVQWNQNLRFIPAMTRLYSGLMTRFNPEFALPNKIRDLQEVLVYMLSQKELNGSAAFKTVGKDAISIKNIIEYLSGKDTEGARMYRQMKLDGGTTGGFGLSTKESVKIDLEKIKKLHEKDPLKAAKVLVEFVDKFNTVIEDSTRLSVYREALAGGLSRQKAAVLAKDASIDFNKMGSGGPWINAIWMFSNASIQGSAKMIMAMKNNPKLLLAVSAAMGTAVAITQKINDAVDPDWRDKVSEWDRLNSFVVLIPTDDGVKYFTIPVSWGLKPFKALFEGLNDWALGKEEFSNVLSTIASTVIEGYNPLGGTDIWSALTPTIADIPMEIRSNKGWTGRDIVPKAYDEAKPMSTRYYKSLKDKATGRMFIGATKKLSDMGIEISPEQLQYVFEQYIGGAGKFLSKTSDTVSSVIQGELPPVKNVPFVSRFLKSVPEEVTSQGAGYWENINKIKGQELKESFYEGQEADKKIEELKKIEDPQAKKTYLLNLVRLDEDLAKKVIDKLKEEAKGQTGEDKAILRLGVESGSRAKYIVKKLDSMKTPEEKKEYLAGLAKRKVITKEVLKQVAEILSK